MKKFIYIVFFGLISSNSFACSKSREAQISGIFNSSASTNINTTIGTKCRDETNNKFSASAAMGDCGGRITNTATKSDSIAKPGSAVVNPDFAEDTNSGIAAGARDIKK